jgi:hypothetical protein
MSFDAFYPPLNQVVVSNLVTVNQGTNPWIVSGAVIAMQGTSPWTVGGTVAATQSGNWTTGRTWTLNNSTDSVNIGNFPSMFGVTQSTSPWVVSGTITSNQGTSPWVVSGTVTSAQSGTWNIGTVTALTSITNPVVVNQGTSPWVTSGTSTVSGMVTANQGTSPWVVSGTVAATQSGAWTTGRTWVLNSTTDSVNVSNFPVTQAVTQSTSPWVVSGTVSAAQSGSWTVAATQSTSPWVVSGTVAATQSGTWNIGTITTLTSITNPVTVNQGTSPWVTSGTSTVTGTVTANQGTSPWVVSGTITANAGANLNTSLLALESGGHLASVDSKVPALGQALAAASVPVVLTAAQLSILTPLSSVTVTQGTAANLNATVVGPAGTTLAKDSSLTTINTTLGTPMQNSGGSVTANAGANLNTSLLALESGGNLASINTKTPALGQALAASSVPIVLTAAQLTTLTPLTSVTVTQGTGTNLHTVVDSGAVNATLSAETTKVIGTINISSGQTVGLAAGSQVIGHVINDASSAVIGHVVVDSAPSTAVTNVGTFAVQATLAAETTKVIGTVNQGTSPWVVSGNVTNLTQGTLTDRSGTATGASTVLMATNSARKFLFIQVTGTKGIWINFTTAATALTPSIFIAPNTVFQMEGSFVSTEAINVIRDSSPNQTYTAKEG